jgi:hypothetical protein
VKTSKFIFSLFFVCFLGVSIASTYNVDPKATAIVVLAVGATLSFATGNLKGVAMLTTQANLFSDTQLQIKEIVKTAIYQHYGWLNVNGQWVKPNGARDIPELLDQLRITRKDFFQIRYLTPTESTFRFFDKAQDANKPFESNFKEASLTANKMFLVFGISGELATGAAATDTPDILAFGAPGAGDEETTNSLINWEINRQKEIEDVVFKSLFINDDAIKNFLRLPRIIVWEPSNSQILTLQLAKAYAAATHKFAKFTLHGLELSR